MKNKILAMLAISSLCLFSACSDDSDPDPTRAELCQAGLSAECLVGTWKLEGATELTAIGSDTLRTINPGHNFSSSPSTITFTDNGDFAYDVSPLFSGSCKESAMTRGHWTITGKSLKLTTTIGNTCFYPKSWENEVKIWSEGGFIQMDIHGIFFLNSEMENADAAEKARTTEIFKISAQ